MFAGWQTIVDELRTSQFVDVDGAEVACVLPISDRLISRLVRQRLPAQSPIRDMEIQADGNDDLTVRFRLNRPALLPPFRLRCRIVGQPDVPRSGVLTLRLQSQGLAALAGPLTRVLGLLPPWVQVDGDRVSIAVDRLLRAVGAPDLIPYLTVLELHTVPQRIVLTMRGGLPASEEGAR